MSVGTTLEPGISRYQIAGLPQKIQKFTVLGTDTGDVTGGQMDFNVHFNVESDRKFQPWVYVRHVAWGALTANPGNMQVVTQAGTFETSVKSDGGTIPLLVVPQNGPGTSIWGGSNIGWFCVGRVLPATTGRVQLRFENVNTAVVRVYMSGILVESPQVIDERIVL